MIQSICADDKLEDIRTYFISELPDEPERHGTRNLIENVMSFRWLALISVCVLPPMNSNINVIYVRLD